MVNIITFVFIFIEIILLDMTKISSLDRKYQLLIIVFLSIVTLEINKKVFKNKKV